MTQDGTSKDDVKVPEGDLGKEIQAGFDEGKDLLVTIISAMGEEAVSTITVLNSFCSSSMRRRPSPTRRPLRAIKSLVVFSPFPATMSVVVILICPLLPLPLTRASSSKAILYGIHKYENLRCMYD